MAVYDGFFDAVQNEETGEYDRAYSSENFTQYFAQIIGSGVCIHDNPESFKVRLEEGKAVVSPGYLFIQGYWCKNDADYTIELPGTGNYAIVAHLNLGKRLIELEARSVAQAYPDSLVLAIVSSTSAEDTRHNTDICGIIDTAGELSSKVEWALNYIDSEIESKLAAVERDINAQAAKLDRKIAEVQAVADSIVPPPVGSIKFSASQDVGQEWLRCDGSFVNEQDYPELVAALGKLTPSGDKFQLLSDGEIGPQITNGALYGGRLWVYSYSTKKLYGVDVEGSGAVKEIEVTSEDTWLNKFLPPSETYPLCLSIVPGSANETAKIFLSQVTGYRSLGSSSIPFSDLASNFSIIYSDFNGTESTISLAPPFPSIKSAASMNLFLDYRECLPYVVSRNNGSAETFYCVIGDGAGDYVAVLQWVDGEEAKILTPMSKSGSSGETYNRFIYQRIGYTHKNRDEAVSIRYSRANSTGAFTTGSYSSPTGLFSGIKEFIGSTNATSYGSINIAGSGKILSCYTKGNLGESEIFLPNASRLFIDAAAYLWGKDIYMIFVGTGIIFSRTLEEGSFGYLDTTSVLGTITQFGYLDYSQDEGTLYLMGQDTSNRVKVAKIVLNTLYDYANDGAWLPMIASDGVPAYIKAYEPNGGAAGGIPVTITVLQPTTTAADLLFNGEILIAGTYTRYVSSNGTFSVGVKRNTASSFDIFAKLNGAVAVTLKFSDSESGRNFKTTDYPDGITLQIAY